MKKAISLALALAMTLSLIGCSSGTESSGGGSSTSQAPTTDSAAFVGNESDEYYMVSFLSGIDYWKHCFEGMEDAGKALGVTTKYTGQTDGPLLSASSSRSRASTV